VVKRIEDNADAGPNGPTLTLARMKKSQRRRRPQPPFITSTLQQEAARRLRFTTQRTMRTAQQLYEGIDIGGGENQGLITYMRTDSVALSNDALGEIRGVIQSDYGAHLVPDKPNFYQSKSKNAQEAHESIRPTSAKLTPLKIKSHLTEEQFRLYQLIWNRAVASQMIPAVYDTVSAEFDVGEETFRANGSILIEPGFLSVYQDAQSDTDNRLPDLKKAIGWRFKRSHLSNISPNRHRVTQRPAW